MYKILTANENRVRRNVLLALDEFEVVQTGRQLTATISVRGKFDSQMEIAFKVLTGALPNWQNWLFGNRELLARLGIRSMGSSIIRAYIPSMETDWQQHSAGLTRLVTAYAQACWPRSSVRTVSMFIAPIIVAELNYSSQ